MCFPAAIWKRFGSSSLGLDLWIDSQRAEAHPRASRKIATCILARVESAPSNLGDIFKRYKRFSCRNCTWGVSFSCSSAQSFSWMRSGLNTRFKGRPCSS